MTGVGVSWSAPAWVGLGDRRYSDLIPKKAEAVNRRDKKRGGKYSVKEAIEAIHQAFHRCNGFVSLRRFQAESKAAGRLQK